MKWIIMVTKMVNGKLETAYHEKFTLSTRIDCMNVYVEHLTTDKKKALVFYDRDEVYATSNFIYNKHPMPGLSVKVITIKSETA